MSFGLCGEIILGGNIETTHSIEQAIVRLVYDATGRTMQPRKQQNVTYPAVLYELDDVEYGKYLKGRDNTAKGMFRIYIESTLYDELASIGLEIRSALDDFDGMAWDRKIFWSLHEREYDTIRARADGSPQAVFGRVQQYEISFSEP